MEARTVLIRFSSAGIQAGAGGQGLEGPSWGVQSQHLSEETCLTLFLLDLSIARWPAGIFAFCLGLLLVVSSGGSAGGCEGLPPSPQSKTSHSPVSSVQPWKGDSPAPPLSPLPALRGVICPWQNHHFLPVPPPGRPLPWQRP